MAPDQIPWQLFAQDPEKAMKMMQVTYQQFQALAGQMGAQ
jgi:hypothetical protein